MKPLQSFLVVTGAALFGAATGVYGMLKFAEQPKTVPATAAAPAVVDAPPRAAARAYTDQLARVQSRIEHLEAKQEGTAADKPAAEPNPEGMVSPEVIRRRVDDALAAHRQEAVDPTWATGTMKALTHGLKLQSPLSRAEVKSVDCRTGTCSAEVRWKSRRDAELGYSGLIEWPLPMNCERTILLPEHVENETSIEATLLLDCNSWRADGSVLLKDEELPPLPPIAG